MPPPTDLRHFFLKSMRRFCGLAAPPTRPEANPWEHVSFLPSTDHLGYNKPPPVEESVVAHLCPTARGWKSTPLLPSKPCRATAHFAEKANMAAGQVVSAIHTMAVLQVFQEKML